MKDDGISHVMHCRNKQNILLHKSVIVYYIFHLEVIGKGTIILTQNFLIPCPFFCTCHELQLVHVLTSLVRR